jgi:predicted DNA-binding transcriptional regulator AlpA
MSSECQVADREKIAAVFGVSTRTVDRWRGDKRFPQPLPLPGRLKKWSVASIERFLTGVVL